MHRVDGWNPGESSFKVENENWNENIKLESGCTFTQDGIDDDVSRNSSHQDGTDDDVSRNSSHLDATDDDVSRNSSHEDDCDDREEETGGRSWQRTPIKQQKRTSPNKRGGVGRQQQQENCGIEKEAVSTGKKIDKLTV